MIEVITKIPASDSLHLAQLPLLSHKRLFEERVPLPEEDRVAIKLSDEWRYAALAEGVEAWGFRAMQERQIWMSRVEVARAWFDDEFKPVVALLREADLIGSATEAEAYIRIVTLRYLLLQTHHWDDEVVERLRAELAKPRPAVDDTLVHQLRRELRT